MPPKIRELKRDLRRAGFENPTDRGKGSHSVWVDPDESKNQVTLSNQDGADAKPYQIKQTKEAIRHRQASKDLD